MITSYKRVQPVSQSLCIPYLPEILTWPQRTIQKWLYSSYIWYSIVPASLCLIFPRRSKETPITLCTFLKKGLNDQSDFTAASNLQLVFPPRLRSRMLSLNFYMLTNCLGSVGTSFKGVIVVTSLFAYVLVLSRILEESYLLNKNYGTLMWLSLLSSRYSLITSLSVFFFLGEVSSLLIGYLYLGYRLRYRLICGGQEVSGGLLLMCYRVELLRRTISLLRFLGVFLQKD